MDRFWCTHHEASATGKYGKRLDQCESAHVDLDLSECLFLDANAYEGGIAIWGAVKPIFDTTELDMGSGIHVHARTSSVEDKAIDQTFPAILLDYQPDLFRRTKTLITQETAVNYYLATYLKRHVTHLACPKCGALHLDVGRFVTKPHRKHLCHACGKFFNDTERSVSNPIAYYRKTWGIVDADLNIKPAKRSISINQAKYPGGIQIWASNPAVLWTALRPEEWGIHIHCYDEKMQRVVDDTFVDVSIDGVIVNVKQVHHLMAQTAIPHVSNKVLSFDCPNCKHPHFDDGEWAFQPHKNHVCSNCNNVFQHPGQRKLTIGNPMVAILKSLIGKGNRS